MVVKRSASSASDAMKEGLIHRIRERNNRVYPPGRDLREDVGTTPDPWVSVPHKQTGEPVGVNLFTDTIDDILDKCGFSEDQRETASRFYRSHLLDRLSSWDIDEVPNGIPLLAD